MFKVPKVNLSLNFFKSKSFFLVVFAGLLIGLSVYIFNKYISKKINPDYVDNKEFTTGHGGSGSGDAPEATLYLFYANWCTYCKKAMPEWKKFKGDYEGKEVKGYKLVFKEYECSEEGNGELDELLDKFNVEGYPTIILVKDDIVERFDAKPTYDTLEEFVNTM